MPDELSNPYALAWSRLKHAGRLTPPLPPGRVSRLCLWDEEHGISFPPKDPWSLTVHVDPGKDDIEPIVREARWRRKAVVCGEPTIMVRDGLLNSVEWRSILRSANQLNLPMIFWREDTKTIIEDIGLAGMALANNDSPASVLTVEWCVVRPPNEWKPLIEWVHQVRAFLERSLGPTA